MRFPEFDDNWVKKKLEDVVQMYSGGTPSMQRAEYWRGDIPFISASSMHNTVISGSHQFITSAGLKNGSKLLRKGNLLLLVRGSMLWKQIPICYTMVDVAFNQDVKGLITNDKSSSLFLLYWFKSKGAILKDMVTSTGIGAGKLDSNSILSISLLLPNKTEQSKIAKFLFLIDKRIETQNKIIEKLETLIKGISEKLFGQSVRFKDDDELDFPKWKIKKLGEVLTIGNGKDYKHLGVGTIPVFGTGGLMTYVNSFLFDGETVCIGRKGTIDRPMYYQGKIWTVDTLFYTHSFVNVLPKFIFYVFKAINWKEHNEASGVPSLSKSTIEKIAIKIPSVLEQRKISDLLSAIDEKIGIERLLLTNHQKQKEFLLDQLFI